MKSSLNRHTPAVASAHSSLPNPRDTRGVATIPGGGDLLLRRPDVELRTGLKRSSLYRTMEQDPSFPRPVKISARAVAWSAAEVDQWIEARKRWARGGSRSTGKSDESTVSRGSDQGGA
jgi:prophage regulatory protein